MATKVLTALATRDVVSANRVFSRDAADREARARKAGFKSYTAFEAERVIGSTDPAAVADTSFLRIRVVERAVIQRAPITKRSMVGFVRVRHRCGRARTSRLRSRPGSGRAASRSRSSGDSDDGGGGEGPDPPLGRRFSDLVVALLGLCAALISLGAAIISASSVPDVPPTSSPAPAVVILCPNEASSKRGRCDKTGPSTGPLSGRTALESGK